MGAKSFAARNYRLGTAAIIVCDPHHDGVCNDPAVQGLPANLIGDMNLSMVLRRRSVRLPRGPPHILPR